MSVINIQTVLLVIVQSRLSDLFVFTYCIAFIIIDILRNEKPSSIFTYSQHETVQSIKTISSMCVWRKYLGRMYHALARPMPSLVKVGKVVISHMIWHEFDTPDLADPRMGNWIIFVSFSISAASCTNDGVYFQHFCFRRETAISY